jgi:Tfp pilus assembly protein PilF
VGTAATGYVEYLAKLLYPAHLAVFYPLPDPDFFAWVLAGAGLLAATALAWRVRGRAPYVTAGWAWFLLTLLPVIGLVQAGTQYIADRFLYFPALGVYVIAVWGSAGLLRGRKLAGAVAAACLVLALGGLTLAQVPVWRNSVTLFLHATRAAPDNYLARHNLGNLYMMQDMDALAVRHLREAVRIRPQAHRSVNDLAAALFRLGRHEEAVALLEGVLTEAPGHRLALRNLALIHYKLGRLERARALYGRLVQSGQELTGLVGLGTIALDQGRYGAAREHFARALRLRPGSREAQQGLERARKEAGEDAAGAEPPQPE